MTNIVMLGGNGYIGRNVTEQWLQHDPQAQFYVLSHSGTNALQNPRVNNIAVDVTDADADESHHANDLPEQVMLQVATSEKRESDGLYRRPARPESLHRLQGTAGENAR